VKVIGQLHATTALTSGKELPGPIDMRLGGFQKTFERCPEQKNPLSPA